eukprot:Phypoly_transcript_10388.p1 GENE.Phypoly_transcript_10388~~Phypoly_transcript_10388.p1  ORF type:complete len:198 (+),score=18.46 Phypoly_transcript_10388:248-841(+)
MLLLTYMETLNNEVTLIGVNVAKLLNRLIPTMNCHYSTPEYHENALVLLIVIVKQFSKSHLGYQLIPDILEMMPAYVTRLFRDLETDIFLSSHTSHPRRHVALVIDLLLPLLDYPKIREAIRKHCVVEIILRMIFQQSYYPLFYSVGVEFVRQIVETGYGSVLLSERFVTDILRNMRDKCEQAPYYKEIQCSSQFLN